MIITLRDQNGKKFDLKMNPEEVKQAKRSVSWFLNRMRKISKDTNRLSFYFTTLIVMNMMSSELLKEMDGKELDQIMTLYAKVDAQKEAEKQD